LNTLKKKPFFRKGRLNGVLFGGRQLK
jgi:hypothetical protein